MISLWFKTKARFGFCHQLLLKELDGRVTKRKDFGKNFPFSNFWKFRNRFWYQLKNFFIDKLSILLELRYVFLTIFTHY